jgi:hypothetical protein
MPDRQLQDRLVNFVPLFPRPLSASRPANPSQSAAIEPMLDYSKEQHRLDRPRTAVERAYKGVRQALIAYGEVALREARERENQLLCGITGRHDRRSPE